MSSIDEIKDMAIAIFDMIFAVGLISAVAVTIMFSTSIWSVVTAQEHASESMRNYAKYVAYDDTTVRGQELINLFSETHGDPFIAVVEGGDVIALSYNVDSDAIVTEIGNGGVLNFSYSANPEVTAAITAVENELSHGFNNWASNVHADDLCLDWDANSTTYIEDVQKWLLETRGSGKYKTYQTALLYDSDSSDTVIGIVALED